MSIIKKKLQLWIDEKCKCLNNVANFNKIFDDILSECNKIKKDYYQDDFTKLLEKIENEKGKLVNSAQRYNYTYEEIYKKIFNSDTNIIPTKIMLNELQDKIADANRFQNGKLMKKCKAEKTRYNSFHLDEQIYNIYEINVGNDHYNKYSYYNHCWFCKHEIKEGPHSEQYCPKCKHYRCVNCGSCFCGKPKYY